MVSEAVFINFLGKDGLAYAGMLDRELTSRFGRDQVFLDVPSIPAGDDFPSTLLDAVGHARVVLAVIGPDWLTATDSSGRRIEHPDNWTHRELAEAFRVSVRVVPVLAEATTLPEAESLPADIRALSTRQAIRLRGREHDTDLARVVRELTDAVPALAAAAAGVRADTAVAGLSDTARDAVEWRVTELYTRATTQLGSEHAQVRIAGFHALERLAQNNPDQRQVIVNVVCGYLRMPYTADDTVPAGSDSDHKSHRTQECQVRLTAQGLLTTHLRRGQLTFWPDITLDLAGATLIDFNLEYCHLHGATFDDARFSGVAQFNVAEFTGPVSFDNARFTSGARFIKTVWAQTASFSRTRFDHEVTIAEATFRSSADFEGTRFEGEADFSGTRFDYVWFDNAHFVQPAMFDRARFTGRACFGRDKYHAVHFGGRTYFRAAQFDQDVIFGGARFAKTTVFDDAIFHDFVGFNDAVFADSAIFTETKLLAEARFFCTHFNGDALFGGSEFGRHANFDSTLFGAGVRFHNVTFTGTATCRGAYARLDLDDQRIWPQGWLLATPPSPDAGRLREMPGRWGQLYDR